MNDLQDEAHLNLLSVFHYVVAGILAFFGLFPVIHLLMGIVMVSGGLSNARGEGPPALFGVFFIVMASVMIGSCWLLAVGLVLSGTCLRRRRRYRLCVVMAAVACLFMPFGTLLGVFTIVVLLRPSVQRMFGAERV